MIERTLSLDGAAWTVSIAGRVTPYERDEFSLVFERKDPRGTERRVARFSPLGARSRSLALRELTDAELRTYFGQSQPAWTSPELGYAGS